MRPSRPNGQGEGTSATRGAMRRRSSATAGSASAGERAARRRQAGPASAMGREARAWPIKVKNVIFLFIFLPQIHSNEFLNLFKVISKVGPKIKVVQKNILYNFAKKSKAKIQIDFEL